MTSTDWCLDPMVEGALYQYRKQGRQLFSEEVLNDIECRWLYDVGSILKNEMVMFLQKCWYGGGSGVSYTLIKVLTDKGTIGWTY